MSSKKYDKHELLMASQEWDNVLTELMDSVTKEKFLARKKAISMYAENYSLNDITKATGLCQSNIVKLVDRCMKTNYETGATFGYSALIPQKRVKSYTRNKETDYSLGKSGAFKQLVDTYGLDYYIKGLYFGDKEITLSKNLRVSDIHKSLLKKLIELGVQNTEYPFNTEDLGLRSLYKYINKIDLKNSDQSMKRQSKDAINKYKSTGNGQRLLYGPRAPYSVVQIDGHRIDVLYTVEVEDPKTGEIINLEVMRPWLVVALDKATKVCLGYVISPHEEYNQTDVLETIKNAIKPKEKIEFTLPGLEYPQNGGFPSVFMEELNWALFNRVMLDNAKAHLAKDVQYKLINKLGCTLEYGPVATPERRGDVESFFRKIEENGYHKLPSTTGSNVSDPRRKNAETNARKYKITHEHLVQLTEYFIALYNNTPHAGLRNKSPLEFMHDAINAGILPCRANEDLKETVENITNIMVTRTVRGSQKSGRRPYVCYEGVDYTGHIISSNYEMVNHDILLEINPNNIKTIQAYLETGESLGVLYATGDWGLKNHSLRVRRHYLKDMRLNKKEKISVYAYLDAYEAELRANAIKSRRDRTKAANIAREQKKVSENTNRAKHEETSPISNIPDLSNSMLEDEKISSEEINIVSEQGFKGARKQGYTR